ncbi:MAG: T9SS type A sorting domain-containing protein, partial [Bacteroidota bacterium]
VFTVSATDPDVPADALTFSIDATSAAKGMSINASTGEFSWIPTEAQDGDHTVIFTVTDDGVGTLSDDETITITVNELPNTWDGTAWSDGMAPTGEDVQLDDDYDFATDGPFTANDLTINASLTVNDEETLIVNNDLVNNGTLLIKSGASLITFEAGSFTGNSVVAERNTRHADGRYSFVGTPFRQGANNTGDDLGAFVYQYDESVAYQPNDGLDRWLEVNDAELIPGKGYAQAGQKMVSYTGIPNTGAISFMGTYTGIYNDGTNEQTEGWNLVSNPYAAAVEVQAFLDENTNLEGAVYLWDDNGSDVERGTNADYVVANGMVATNTTPAGGQGRYNGFIGSAQGFFVKLSDDTDTQISFTEAMRSSGNNADGNFFRSDIPSYVRVNLSDGKDFFKQIILGRVEGISDTEVDRSFDARVFDQEASSFYSIKGDAQALAIQGFSEKEEIELGYSLPATGTYELSIETDEFDGGQVELLDKVNGTTVDLNQQPYEFTVDLLKDADRFVVMLRPTIITAVDEITPQGFYCHSSTGRLDVFFRQKEASSVQVSLIDLHGRRVYESAWQQPNEQITIETGQFPAGVYMLQVAGSSIAGKTKVIIR